jgi:hypothetical protein
MHRILVPLIALMFVAAQAAAPVDTKAPDVSVAVGDEEIEVTNNGTQEWREMEIRLNDVMDGFKLKAPAPASGSKVRISLTRFVDKKGNRFNPAQHAVVKLWIGGSGRDFQLFNVR